MPENWYSEDGLAAAKRDAIPGCCLFCGECLPEPTAPRARLICDSPSCKTAYMRAWRRDQRAGAPKLNTLLGAEIRWHCDCGRSYCHEFFRAVHRYRCLFARDAWPEVVVPPASTKRSTEAA